MWKYLTILVIKNANYYNPLLCMYQKSKWYKELKCPETEGSVGMSVHLQSLQEATFPENILAIYFTSMPSNTT